MFIKFLVFLKIILILNFILNFTTIIINCNEINNNNNNNYNNNNLKISKKLNNEIENINYNNDNNEKIKIWVSFNKKNKDDDENNLKNIDKFLKLSGIKKESIERRKKRCHNKERIIDESDIPITQNYIDQVLSCSDKIKLIQKSNWLNSISILFEKNENNKIIDCIKSLEFVNKIDIVSKYKKINHIDHHHHHHHKKNENENENSNSNKIEQLSKIKLLQQEQQPLPTIQPTPSNSNNNNSDNNNESLNNEDDWLDPFYGHSEAGIKQLNIDKLHDLGFDGNGVTILITDTGFLKSHETFKKLKIAGERNFVKNSINTQDVNNPNILDINDQQTGHGTFTLSTLAGYTPGFLIGAAYNASYLLAETEIATQDYEFEEDYWIAALEWGEKMGAQLVSSSLGYELWYTFPDFDGHKSHISRAADYATTKGMVVVVGVGNSAEKGMGIPADAEHVIAVGAVDRRGIRAEFSSLGPTADGRIKPDVMALGVENMVAHNRNNETYAKFNGTSFSCPLVASGIALLLQAHPNWTVKQIYEAVIQSAPNYTSPNYYTGYGIFDAFAAYNYKPSVDNCTITGCSDSNGFCEPLSNLCLCEDGFYGQFCQYKRLECGDRCTYLNSTCQIREYGEKSYLCVAKSKEIGDFSNNSSFNFKFINFTFILIFNLILLI